MHFTCKRCCIILKEKDVCPVCGEEDQVAPIHINLQASEKRIDLEESQ